MGRTCIPGTNNIQSVPTTTAPPWLLVRSGKLLSLAPLWKTDKLVVGEEASDSLEKLGENVKMMRFYFEGKRESLTIISYYIFSL